ncbi:MAG: tRNA epoxyqueuosine(34) reductase QueG [Bdellovibrionales bacterium]|nr:tRNA epoxyqueuosine(34) reductase QueG [Bdellovibrionales bacterium]
MPHIDQLFQEHKIENFKWIPLEKPITLEFYKTWLNQQMHGDMKYMEKHLPYKEDPTLLLKKAQSAIVFLVPYYPHPYKNDLPLKNSHVALYAKNADDYHIHLQNQINQICQKLNELFPGDEFIGFTDSKPVLERDLAYKAGLGWFGKNACILNKSGSYFFIAEIYSTKAIEAAPVVHPNHCGNCTRCIDACPTDAIVQDKVIDARLCISYLTIESKSVASDELKPKIGSWLFGCDICQSVCPWNKKHFGDTEQTLSSELYEKDLEWILTSSNKELARSLQSTPLSRAAGWKLKRNAIIVATNLKLKNLLPHIEKYQDHEKLNDLVTWSKKNIH